MKESAGVPLRLVSAENSPGSGDILFVPAKMRDDFTPEILPQHDGKPREFVARQARAKVVSYLFDCALLEGMRFELQRDSHHRGVEFSNRDASSRVAEQKRAESA
jgi:hypothetical protein